MFDFPKRNHAKKSDDDVSYWMLSRGASDTTLQCLQRIGVRNGREIAGGILLITVPSKYDAELEKLKDSALARQLAFDGRSKFQAMRL